MNEVRKNVVVGIFVLGALAAVGTLIVLFGRNPQILSWHKEYHVSIYFPTAGTIENDAPVYLNGLIIGRVDHTEPQADVRKGVKIICWINQEADIPTDAHPVIQEQSIGFGKSALRIEVGPKNSPQNLPKDGTGTLEGTVTTGITSVIPPDVMKKLENATESLTRLANALKPVADDLHVLFKPQPLATFEAATQAATQPTTRPLANISTLVQRFDTAVKSLNDVLANPANKNNVTAMIANFRTVSENGVTLTRRLNDVARTMDTKIDKVAAGLVQSTDKLSQLFDKLNEIAQKMSAGQGSAAKLVNDPELYDALTFTARKLSQAVDDLRALIIQWQEHGLKIQGGLLGK